MLRPLLPHPALQENQKNELCAPGKFDVVVTSYEMVIKVRSARCTTAFG